MRILIIFFLIVKSVVAIAQTEWAPIGAKWYYDKPEGLMSGAVGYILISSIKDSVIGSKNVRVLTVDYFKPNGTVEKYPNIYTFSELGKVYYWNNNQFLLLYNFTAAKDTVWQINNGRDTNNCGKETSGSVIVDSVREEQIDKKTLKCLYVSPYKSSICEYRKIIEPIGSTFYMLPVPIFCGVADDFPFAAPLRCYEDPTFGIVHFDLFAQCDYITTANKQLKENKINVFPNPFSSSITFKLATNHNIQAHLTIFNTLGVVIYQRDKLDLNEIIDLNFLRPGIYLVQILENNRVIFFDKIFKI